METKIYQAIANAMKEISPIAKGKKNKEQGFAYRGVDDVMNELNPILAKHNVFIYPEVIASQRSERQTQKGGTLLYSILTIKYHFATDDGSEVCTTVIGEGMDSGDKASNKAMAVAFKYACLQMFCIPTDDIDDPDKETPPQLKPNGSAKQQTPPAPQNGNERAALQTAIGDIVNAKNPDQYPYFTDAEINQERAIFKGAANINVIKNQHERLKKELEKRTADFKPIPFSDEIPDDGFEDDIPEVTNEPEFQVEPQLDIF